MRRSGLVLLLALAVLSWAPAASATPVATSDSDYSALGRVFPDPLAGCSGPVCSPTAQGNTPATQFIQYLEFVDALGYMNSKPEWSRYLEVWPLDDGQFVGNDLGRLEFTPKAEYQSAGLPTTDLERKKSDLFVLRVTDESVPDKDKKRYALSLSIHGIERAGLEGGTRAAEDLVTAATTGKADDPVVPREVDPAAPTFAEVLRETIIYFTYPNPDGWRRGSVSEGGFFFQRYNGNGVDLNRDWPDIGFSFRPYSGLSEPESRALAAFFDDVKSSTGDEFDAGDDLHGQPTADALSYTLLPHGRHDFAKDQRIRDTAIAIHRNSERALLWSPIIKPNDAPPGSGPPCVPGPVGDACAQIYGQTWGTVYDTINYTTTGALGDYFDSSIGLGADGIDNEMSFSHLDKNIVFDPHTEQLHVDGNKALIFAHLARILDPQPKLIEVPGRQGYIPSARLKRAQSDFQPGAPAGTSPQADIAEQAGTPAADQPGSIEFPFEVQRNATTFNGGMRVDITKESLQGVGNALLTLKLQCKRCDDHPGVKESDDWVTVSEDFNQSPVYLQAGLTAAVNRPQPAQWRALLDGPAVARMSVDFSSERATTDGPTGGDDPPVLRGYDVANTDFFKDLNRYFADSGERFVPVRSPSSLAGLRSLVVADRTLPPGLADGIRDWVHAGGNLVLTDGALQALPSFTSIPAAAIKRQTVYVGSVAFAEEEGGDTTGKPLAQNVRQPGSRFGGGSAQKRRQTFEPTPLGFSIQNAESGADESHARQWHVDKAAFKAAGGDVVATSSTESANSGAADFDNVTVGQLRLGEGTIRIAGALLPQPTEEFDHPQGIEPYALTYTGYILACNLIDCTIRAGTADTGCVRSGRQIRGKRVGRALLGRTRARQRRVLGGRLLSRRGDVDRYCLRGGGTLRIAYRRRARLVLTNSSRATLRGISRGSSVRALRRKLRGERRVKVGRNVWYLAPSRRARLVFKVRRGKVRELGLASKRPTRTRRAARRFFRGSR